MGAEGGGDWYCLSNPAYRDKVNVYNGETITKGSDPVWLPRQDQLQGMIDLKEYDYLRINPIHLHKIESYSFDFEERWGGKAKTVHGYSMEQLWLAFVMHELHNLTWHNEQGWTEGVE